MEIDPFMKALESAIESGSNRLMAEAGFRMEAGHDAD
jgi:hypothetical protein